MLLHPDPGFPFLSLSLRPVGNYHQQSDHRHRKVFDSSDAVRIRIYDAGPGHEPAVLCSDRTPSWHRQPAELKHCWSKSCSSSGAAILLSFRIDQARRPEDDQQDRRLDPGAVQVCLCPLPARHGHRAHQLTHCHDE